MLKLPGISLSFYTVLYILALNSDDCKEPQNINKCRSHYTYFYKKCFTEEGDRLSKGTQVVTGVGVTIQNQYQNNTTFK